MAVKIIDNCCSPAYLDFLKQIASSSENWNLNYPPEFSIDDRFPKLHIVWDRITHPFLAGLAQGLLLQIHETGGRGLFVPEILFCGISIKD